MKRSVRHGLLFGVLVLVLVQLVAAETPGRTVPAEQFTRLHTLLRPHDGEDRWAEIPWLTSLWEARKRAAAEGKPILLWEMDGHPLGCT